MYFNTKLWNHAVFYVSMHAINRKPDTNELLHICEVLKVRSFSFKYILLHVNITSIITLVSNLFIHEKLVIADNCFNGEYICQPKGLLYLFP